MSPDPTLWAPDKDLQNDLPGLASGACAGAQIVNHVIGALAAGKDLDEGTETFISALHKRPRKDAYR